MKIKLLNNIKTPTYGAQNIKNVKGERFVYHEDLRGLTHPN